MEIREERTWITFETMYKDRVTAKIKWCIESFEVQVEYDETVPMLLRPFCFKESYSVKDIEEFLEDRCIPRTRSNIDEWLKYNGFSHYSPLAIVRKTHGVMWEDFIWIRFEGEDLTYEDIRIR